MNKDKFDKQAEQLESLSKKVIPVKEEKSSKTEKKASEEINLTTSYSLNKTEKKDLEDNLNNYIESFRKILIWEALIDLSFDSSRMDVEEGLQEYFNDPDLRVLTRDFKNLTRKAVKLNRVKYLSELFNFDSYSEEALRREAFNLGTKDKP